MNMIEVRSSTKHYILNRAVTSVAIALVILLLAGCSNNPFTDPKPLMLETELDYGPAEYRAGYEDGCKSALSAYGNTYMRSIYGIQKRAQYQNNKMYNQVWKDSWNFCYMWIFAQRSDNDSLL